MTTLGPKSGSPVVAVMVSAVAVPVMATTPVAVSVTAEMASANRRLGGVVRKVLIDLPIEDGRRDAIESCGESALSRVLLVSGGEGRG